MVNYIRAEFYKVFRRRYTWITLVVLLALLKQNRLNLTSS